MKRIFEDKKAITLIALVITIVVLVILAVVTISLTVGNDGLIARALKAAKGYKDAQEKDKQSINDLYGEILVASDGTIQNLTVEKLNEIIDNRIKASDTNPIGTVISIMANSAPTNYLACDGSWYPVDGDYKALADYIKEEFGSYDYFKLDGESTQANKFKVPDLRGEFLRGTGTNNHQYGGKGADVGIHQAPTVIEGNRVDGGRNVVFGYNSETTSQTYSKTNADVNNISNAVVGANSTTYYSFPKTQGLESLSYTTRPTNTSVLYCIKAK